MKAKIGIALLALVVALLGYAAIKPGDYEVSREVTINAPADKVFPYLNKAKLFEQWSPWAAMDPEAKMIYSGPEEGVGAKTEWDSKGGLGTASATIYESVPNEKVGVKIEYVKPMTMLQDSHYLIRPEGDKTVVTWKVQGTNSYIGRLMCIFVNVDKKIGGFFEKALANLKALTEGAR